MRKKILFVLFHIKQTLIYTSDVKKNKQNYVAGTMRIRFLLKRKHIYTKKKLKKRKRNQMNEMFSKEKDNLLFFRYILIYRSVHKKSNEKDSIADNLREE